MTYRDALTEAMNELARDERTLFIGQGVRDAGTYMSTTLQGVPLEKRIEFPVAEEMQLGVSIGMALDDMVPVSVFPRWNFFVCAANQAINHLDKMGAHVIIRVGIGSTTPLDPGPQHKGDWTDPFRVLMPNTNIARIYDAADATPTYAEALATPGPWIVVEEADRYEFD